MGEIDDDGRPELRGVSTGGVSGGGGAGVLIFELDAIRVVGGATLSDVGATPSACNT